MNTLLKTLALTSVLGAALAYGKPAPDAVDAQIQRDLHYHIAELAGDAYQGRQPGTPGEDKTIAWLQKHFAELGTQPGNAGSWVQEVPITAVTSAPSSRSPVPGSRIRSLYSSATASMLPSAAGMTTRVSTSPAKP